MSASSYVTSHLISILPSGRLGAARTLRLTYNNEIVNNKNKKKMNKEAKRDGDYVSYRELFRLVQAGRRELGLPEYKRRSSLHFALVANRIPAKKVNCRKMKQ